MNTTSALRPWTRGTHSASFVFAVVLGLGVLVVLTLIAGLFEGGDCFGTDAQCGPFWLAQQSHFRLLNEIAGGLLMLGVVAIVFGRRTVPTVLFVASSAVLALGIAHLVAGTEALAWLPNGLFLLSPAALILALASVGQVRQYRAFRAEGSVTGSRDIRAR